MLLSEPYHRLLLGMMIQPQEIFEALILGEAVFGKLHIAVERGGGLRLQIGRPEAGEHTNQHNEVTNNHHSSNIIAPAYKRPYLLWRAHLKAHEETSR